MTEVVAGDDPHLRAGATPALPRAGEGALSCPPAEEGCGEGRRQTTTPLILVPIYKPRLDASELRSLDISFAALVRRRIAFIGPAGLDIAFYRDRYPTVDFLPHDPVHFASIAGYNRLLLRPDFYRSFAPHDHLLILQTDAVVLDDRLDHWLAQPFDYVGAPWPEPVELFVNLDRFAGANGRRVRATVGNGGLSLRRAAACADLLSEFPQACDYFTRSGSSEDLYFSLLGPLSANFVVPNEITASTFAMELRPAYYFEVNGGRSPMGGHAWWKYEPAFWAPRLAEAEAGVAARVAVHGV